MITSAPGCGSSNLSVFPSDLSMVIRGVALAPDENYGGLFRGKAAYLAGAASGLETLSFVGPYDVEVSQY